jgi:pilus assembly protein Flp/PilA
MLRFFRKLRKDENGATAIEYGLIAGLISVVIIAAVGLVGNELKNVFNYETCSITLARRCRM